MVKDSNSLEGYLIAPGKTVQDALALIEQNTGKVALVVKADNTLLGTITDGDVRRALLGGIGLEAIVDQVMNTEPKTLNEADDSATIFSFMQSQNIRNVPIVNANGQVIRVANLADIIIPDRKDNWVVIMAGGLGTRLHPLTHNVPKPMLKVAGSPVLEILIQNFISQGFYRFYVSVNYLADQIKEHFGDGSRYGVEVRYLEEKQPLGTAGSLSLLQHKPENPFIVINGDIVTNIRFTEMLDFHMEDQATVTMGVREHAVQIPYGVVELDGCQVSELSEKPTEKYFINTGIYVLDPEALSYVPDNTELTMPELMKKAQVDDKKVQAFPVTQSWLDIGRMEDFAKAESLLKHISNEI